LSFALQRVGVEQSERGRPMPMAALSRCAGNRARRAASRQALWKG